MFYLSTVACRKVGSARWIVDPVSPGVTLNLHDGAVRAARDSFPDSQVRLTKDHRRRDSSTGRHKNHTHTHKSVANRNFFLSLLNKSIQLITA